MDARSAGRVGVGGLCLPEPERGKVWKPSQGFHYNAIPFPEGASRRKPADPERSERGGRCGRGGKAERRFPLSNLFPAEN
jgi:hypothetical protein